MAYSSIEASPKPRLGDLSLRPMTLALWAAVLTAASAAVATLGPLVWRSAEPAEPLELRLVELAGIPQVSWHPKAAAAADRGVLEIRFGDNPVQTLDIEKTALREGRFAYKPGSPASDSTFTLKLFRGTRPVAEAVLHTVANLSPPVVDDGQTANKVRKKGERRRRRR